MFTRLTNKIPISKDTMNELRELLKNKYILFEDKDIILSTEKKILLPDNKKYFFITENYNISESDILKEQYDKMKFLPDENFRSVNYNDKEFLVIQNCDKGNFLKNNNNVFSCKENFGYVKFAIDSVNNKINKYMNENDVDKAEAFKKLKFKISIFLVLDVRYSSEISFLSNVIFKYDILPKGISDNCKKEIMKLILLNKTILEEVTESRNRKNILQNYLLECEKIRADIECYDQKMLTDPNRGHWDVWCDEQYDDEAFGYSYSNKEIFSRNPKADINVNGVIGIDFGTKSTVVVYQSDMENTLPMAIGDGNISKGADPIRFENPTIMQCINLEEFLYRYNISEGRPMTRWEDLVVSHTAKDRFNNCKSDDFYSFIREIKQWAGERRIKQRIKTLNGEDIILQSFDEMDIEDESNFNPIEIYAYYIGLYINNMHNGHGIFLDYYMSFPVTYEKNIREKIIKSFERGLRKSLPINIQRDDEIMEMFSVNGNISEPEAYAVCALQEYGIEPDDEEIFYAIFDFGGGTTDFDFGVWKNSEKRRYDYYIESFGSGGDKYLGGENILKTLAFEIFKENQDFMRKNSFEFSYALNSKEFRGADSVVSTSQEAIKNMHNLMEILRPYWESSYESFDEDYDDKDYDDEDYDDEEELIVNLFNKEGVNVAGVKLHTSLKNINDIIESQIRKGVDAFFSSLLLSFGNGIVTTSSKVNIFLAGNSCKSPLVYKIFEEKIREETEKISKKKNINSDEILFEIYPPLGTKESYEKMEKMGIVYDENNERPTGKTGVAFGLIECRKGGVIERKSTINENEEIEFQYFIGWKTKKKFEIFKDSSSTIKNIGKPDFDKWHKFISAEEDTFYIFYTSLSDVVNGDVVIDGNPHIKRIKCSIDNVYEDADIYIKASSPHSIQYVVSKSDNIDKDKMSKIYEKDLR